MRLVVSGGGSGGHVTPVLATIAALRQHDSQLDVLYIGGKRGLESTVASAAGLEFAGISSGKFRRAHGGGIAGQLANPGDLARNLRDSGRIARGYTQALRQLRKFKPDVVFLKGGGVSLPVGMAARTLGIPYVVHESDISPGLTNRRLAPKASAIATGWPIDNYKAWLKDKLTYTGIPVRADLKANHRLEGMTHFGFDLKLPVVLVTGGGLGARGINDLMVQLAPRLTEEAQVIIATGEGEIERVRFALSRLNLAHPKRFVAKAYLMEDIGLALAAADIVVARAGATTIAELAFLAKPTILIPNQVMAGHQVANAQLLSRAGAARVLKEDKLTPSRLAAEIERLLRSEQEQQELSTAIKQFAVPDAADRLAKLIAAQAPEPEEEVE